MSPTCHVEEPGWINSGAKGGYLIFSRPKGLMVAFYVKLTVDYEYDSLKKNEQANFSQMTPKEGYPKFLIPTILT